MKNKSLLAKFWLIVVTISCFGASYVWATNFMLNMNGVFSLSDQISRNIVPIHFVDNGNDFWWFIYFSKEYVEGSLDPESWNSENETLTKKEVFDVKIKECGDDECRNQYQKECSTQVKWLYYNAERWDRLRPLDNLTKEKGKQQWIQWLLWWIYTDCRKVGYNEALENCEKQYKCEENQEDCGEIEGDLKSCVADIDNKYPKDNAYYGMVTWEMEPRYWWETFSFLIGVEYDTGNTDSWIKPKEPLEFTGNLINIGNPSTVVGFVYDNNGGIGFAWCEIKDNWSNKVQVLKELLGNQGDLESQDDGTWFIYEYDFINKKVTLSYSGGSANWVDCENIWMAGDSLMKLIIEWLVGVNRETDVWVKWSQIDSKMQYFSSSDISSATLLNFTKQRSEILCRWKWKQTYNANDRKKSDIVCLSGVNVGSDTANAIKNESEGKLRQTLIVRGGNVTVKPFTDSDDASYYDIFINNGNLIIDEGNAPENVSKFVFTKQWFIANQLVADFKKAVDEAIQDWGNYNLDNVAVWSFIRWNFIINGNVKSSDDNGSQYHKLWNKYFIYWKFSSMDSIEELENVFAWRCSNGFVKWMDEDQPAEPDIRWYCPPSVYENASLVVIDQNYQSPLYW